MFMKKKLSLLLAVMFVTFFNSCHSQEKVKWKEMEEFHTIMAQTFHPAEEGKMEPIKSRSQEMLDKAIAWESSTAPAGYDQNAVKKTLKDLVKGAKEINKLIKENAQDNIIKEKLSGLHDIFHEIMEKCEKEDHIN